MVLGAVVLDWIQPDNSGGLLGFLSRTIELLREGLLFGGAGWIVYTIVALRPAEYSVTNGRVLGHEGLLRSRATDTLLTSVADVRTVVSAVGSTLRYGSIRIVSSSGAAGEDTFSTVREVEAFEHQILEQKAGSGPQAATGSTGGPSPLTATPLTSTQTPWKLPRCGASWPSFETPGPSRRKSTMPRRRTCSAASEQPRRVRVAWHAQRWVPGEDR
jgi:hypothetical protein